SAARPGCGPPAGGCALPAARAEPLRLQRREWRLPQIPDQPELREQPEGTIAQVELPPVEALVGAALVGMMVVVPAFAQGQEREEWIVAARVAALIAAPAEDVGKGVDGEG